MKVIKINNEISSELKEIIYNTKNNVESNKEKICYLTNSINKLNNKSGVPGNSITPSEKNIELLLGECKKIDYLISSYDLQENIDIIIKDDNIITRVDKQIIKANNLGDTIIYIKDYNNNLTDIINVSVIENKNNNYSENLICNLEGKNVIRTDGNKVLFQDSSGNGNGFISENNVNFSVNKEEGYVLYPGQLYLGETMETTYGGDFIPLLEGRSSTGRLGINIHATAGWGDVGFRGKWTLEISAIKPVRVYPGVEICQYVLETGEGKVEHRYHGKYQNQDGVIASRINLDFK